MELIGRALARLAIVKRGQFFLELPDDLPPESVAALVEGANSEVATTPPFAIFATGRRRDVDAISPQVTFRELAMYRQGDRLAIAYASENRGMATYSSVYPLLLASGFPVADSAFGGTGVVGFSSFAAMLAALVEERFGLFGLRRAEFQESFEGILRFLANAYQAAGNGQTGFVTDWWLHVSTWLERLGQVDVAGLSGVAGLHGCAGLPVPEEGCTLKLEPREYVAVLGRRWSNPASIRAELARLEGIPECEIGAARLSELDWEGSFTRSSLRTDSPVARVARGEGWDSNEVARGWACISETQFKDSYVNAKGKLRIWKGGQELVAPWQTGLPLLRVGSNEAGTHGNTADLQLELHLPARKDAKQPPPAVIGSELWADIEVAGLKGTSASFHLESVATCHQELVLAGTLSIQVPRRSKNVLGLEVQLVGPLAKWFPDACSGRFTILWPNDIALWVKPLGKPRGSTLMGPIFSDEAGIAATRVEVQKPGIHDFALAWGADVEGDNTSIRFGSARAGASMPGMEGFSVLAQTGIDQPLAIAVGGNERFEVVVATAMENPKSPFAAAARGLSPDTKTNAPPGLLTDLERVFIEVLENLRPGHAAGCIVLAASKKKAHWLTTGTNVWYSEELTQCLGQMVPALPSDSLLSLPAYVELIEAYRDLGVNDLIDEVQASDDVSPILSQLPLSSLNESAVERLLSTFSKLQRDAASLSPSDRFWAHNPFSVLVVPPGPGVTSAQALMLSPLHPLRIAWAWRVQAGLREAFDDGQGSDVSLALLDGTYFPAYALAADSFGDLQPFVPIRIDARPEDLFLGWHASVVVISHSLAIPEWVDGRRFPVDGLSGLTEASVGAAIDDFIRVAPHVQVLKVALASSSPTIRSGSIDQGLLSKIRDLALSSVELDGVAGVKIFDSAERIGTCPALHAIEDAFPLARPGFNVEWTVVSSARGRKSPHITILEGNASKVSLTLSKATPTGWLGEIPIRRTPYRLRENGFTTISYALASPKEDSSSFHWALYQYENVQEGGYSIRISPNLAGVVDQPRWLVAGDFGVDPKTLSTVASLHGQDSYVLWDWRPAAAIRGRAAVARLQPYFVLAAVPKALGRAICDRIKKLAPSVNPEEVDRRARLLISTLAERAIGLNTLLAIGHHQATGALGFYFALRSASAWLSNAPKSEIRLLIPVDAVDPFLRGSGLAKFSGDRKRADLLAVRMSMDDKGRAQVILAPVEIKHYGLSSGESETGFPKVGEARLEEHLEQLRSYQDQLVDLCDAYTNAGRGAGHFVAERLVSVLDAALQLNPELGDSDAMRILRSVASRAAKVSLGKGVLMWFQPYGVGPSGAKATVDEIGGSLQLQRVEVRVDPAFFDENFWSSAHFPCSAFDCVTSALLSATLGADDGGLDGASQSASSLAADMQVQPSAAATEASSKSDASAMPGLVTTMRAAQASEASLSALAKRMSQDALEARYGELLNSLREFNVKVERPRDEPPYREGPAFIEFAVAPAYGVSVSKIESQLPNVKLRLRLPSDANIGCATHMGNVVLTVPKLDSERYFIEAAEIWPRFNRRDGKFDIPVGEDISGEVVSIDLSDSNSPHLLIAGVTGSGKSEALLTILHGAAHFYGPGELRLKLVDPKQTELASLAGYPHVDGAIGSCGEDAIEVLNSAVDEMERRYSEFRSAGKGVRSIAEYQAKVGAMPRWIIVLDEYADLIVDDNERKLIEKGLQRLSQKARAAGIHVIVCTQKPVVKVIDTVIKGNLPGKVALRVNTAIESRVILDEDGAQELTGKGDAILKIGNVRTRVQFAKCSI